MELLVGNFPQGYIDVCQYVAKHGNQVAPRGVATREMLAATLHILNPYNVLPTDCGRKLNKGIAVAEALQLIAGESHPDLMVKQTSNFESFTDGGTWFHGAYGPRIKRQVPRVLEMLKADHDTRQAVITIWDPAYDGYSDVRDTPCTVMFQFMIRDEQLHMSTYMRSNDVWWGLAYDLFQFTSLQVMMSEVLRIPAGEYHHHVGSLHVYERDLELVKQLEAKSPKVFVPPFNVELKHDGTWESIQARASSILSGNVDARFSDRELALHRALNR